MISNRISLQAWLALLGLGVAAWVLLSHVALILEVGWVLLGAVLLSLAIRPLADKAQTWHIPRGVTTIAVYFVLIAILLFVSNLSMPIIRSEITQLQQSGPQLWAQIEQRLADTPFAGWLPTTDSLITSMGQQLDTLAVTAFGTVTRIGDLILDLFLLAVFAYFFVTNSNWSKQLLLNWIPDNQHARANQLLVGIKYQLTRWVWAQLGLALYFGLTFTLALSILRVPFALTIGLIGGILEFIPYLGSLVALFLGVLTALTVGPVTAVWLILLYAVVAFMQGHVVAPFLYGRAIGLQSAMVLLALFVGVKATGVLGMFFAVPLTVILTAVVQEGQIILLNTEAGT